MKLMVGGRSRVFRASDDGAEGVVLCLNPRQRELEGAVYDTLVDTLGTQAELEPTQPLRWMLLAHLSERFEQSCQRVIDTISALGADVELLELDNADERCSFAEPGRPAERYLPQPTGPQRSATSGRK